jgi:prevent-host-death family protein
MSAASVTELKAHLSKYLRMVRRGSEVQILERGVPIARIVGIRGASADRGRVARLTKAGVLRRGHGDLSWLLDEPKLRGADTLEALEADREDRL